MGIFKSIIDKIFPAARAAENASQTSAPAAAPQSQVVSDAAKLVVVASQLVDVEAILEAMQAKNPQKLNWKTSIVDLLKLLGLDSSLNARKELATELKYTGDMNDSAAMNIWLHKEVMRKFAENGGKLPDDLKH